MSHTGNMTRRGAVAAALLAAGMVLPGQAQAAKPPIKFGVIAEASSIVGASIPKAAQLAADEINAKGGVLGRKIEIVTYDDHNSASDAVRAFQRAHSQDHVSAVIASYISEVVLALQPWAGRLKLPMITPGAASDLISHNVHNNYDHLKYTFEGWLASSQLAESVCTAAKDLLPQIGAKTAVVMSEDAAWTIPLDAEYLKCLPKAGIKVLDHIRLSPDTTDYTPIFNRIEAKKPDVIITGISHVGAQPTVQWHQQQVPIPMFGISSQATSPSFWKDTNGAAASVVIQSATAPNVAVTPKTIPFAQNFEKKFHSTPAYAAYSTYDDVYMFANAIKRAGSTDPDKIVAEMEKTDYVGTIGRITFLGRKNPLTHAMRYGKGYITGLMQQWRDGKLVTVWPAKVATTKMEFPSYMHINKK